MARAIRAEQEAKDAQVYTDGGRKGLATQGTYGDGYGGGTGYGGSTGRRDSVRRGGWAKLGALRSLGRLYAGESDSDDAGDGDDDGGEDRGRYYPEWDKDAAHEMLLRALMRNVLTDGDQTKWRYFQLALNRVRSGVTHNVLSRECFDDDTQLEQLALIFARFDADHDGVLDWDDFCRVLLRVGSRVVKTYAENDLKQRWATTDVNGDGMIDLNEFCRMAWSGYALAGAEPAPWPQPKEDDEWEYDDEFVATDRTASELTFLDEDAALELEGEDGQSTWTPSGSGVGLEEVGRAIVGNEARFSRRPLAHELVHTSWREEAHNKLVDAIHNKRSGPGSTSCGGDGSAATGRRRARARAVHAEGAPLASTHLGDAGVHAIWVTRSAAGRPRCSANAQTTLDPLRRRRRGSCHNHTERPTAVHGLPFNSLILRSLPPRAPSHAPAFRPRRDLAPNWAAVRSRGSSRRGRGAAPSTLSRRGGGGSKRPAA